MTGVDWTWFVLAAAVLAFHVAAIILIEDLIAHRQRRDPEPEGATEDWHPAAYREAVHAGEAAAEHEPVTTWEQKQRIFADEIAWYRRKARAIRRWTQAFDTAEVHALLEGRLAPGGPVEPVRTETGDGWQQPALRLRGLPPVVEEIHHV